MRSFHYILLLILASICVSATLSNDTLLACWTLDSDSYRNTTLTAEIKAGFDGLGTTSGMTKNIAGKIGQAVNFYGTTGFFNITASMASLANKSYFQQQNLTLSYWINYNATAATFPQAISYDSPVAVSMGYSSGLTNTANVIGGFVNPNGASSQSLNGGNTSAGTWYFVTYNFGPSLQRLYVNSYLVDTDTVAGSLRFANNSFLLGAYSRDGLTSPTGYLNGSVDDAAIWNTTLTQQDIITLYNAGAGTSCANYVNGSVAFSIVQNTYNVTSAYLNDTAWRTNTSATVFTRDATPTTIFNLTTAGNCSVSKLNLNYTSMVANDSNTLCATTGSIAQSCTLPETQRLARGSQSIYIACFDGTQYTNSSALTIQLDPISIDDNSWNVVNAFINGTAWRISKNNTVTMRNRAPQVCFNTTVAGNCSLSRYAFNYTGMIANNSATACPDGDNITHCCNLPSNEPLINGAQYLYVGCKADTGDTHGSTSGGLNTSMQRRIAGYVLIANGSSNYTYAGGLVDLFQPSTNATLQTNVSNATGGYEFWLDFAGTFRTCDHINATVRDVCTNDIVVS